MNSTATYNKFDSQRDAKRAYQIGQAMWLDGQSESDLRIVTAAKTWYDVSNSRWAVTLELRTATHEEYVALRLQWLKQLRGRALWTCSFDNPNPGSLEISSRAEVAAYDAEIEQLTKESI